MSHSKAPIIRKIGGVENGRGGRFIASATAGYSTRKIVARKNTMTITAATSEYVKAHSVCDLGTVKLTHGRKRLTVVSSAANRMM